MADVGETLSNHDKVVEMGNELKHFNEALKGLNGSIGNLEKTANSLSITLTKLEQNLIDGRNETARLLGQGTLLTQEFNKHVVETHTGITWKLGRHDLLLKIGLAAGGFGCVTWGGVNLQTLIVRLSSGS